MTLDDDLDAIFAARDRGNMAPTIAAFARLHAEHPGHPRVLYELAGAYDTAGEEARAAELYEQAIAAGLDGDLARRCALQYGSTLRNLGRFEESRAVFAAARKRHPESASLAAFEALTLHAAGDYDAAVATLLDVVADHVEAAELERYRPALRGNADAVRAGGGRE